MFDTLLTRIRRELTTLKSVLDTHESLRIVTFNAAISGIALSGREDLFDIAKSAPLRTDWLLYDHCAAVTRLYAIFESFIEELVTRYLDVLPDLYSEYIDLPPKIRTQHRVGVAQILQKLGREGLYRDMSEGQVIAGLAAGQSSDRYHLFADAFLVDPQNYRAEMVNQIFGYLDFVDIWAGVEAHDSVQLFMTTRDPAENARGLLKKLVEDRNIASHALTTDVWAVAEMRAIASFLEAIVEALVQIVSKKLIVEKARQGQIKSIGRVIHIFSNEIVGISCNGFPITVGESIVVSQHAAAFTVKVVSIKEGQNAHESYLPKPGQDLGIRFDRKVAINAELFSSPFLQIELLPQSPLEEVGKPDDYEVPELTDDND